MKTIDCKQGSAEWFHARSGLFTASNADVVIPLPSYAKKGVVKYSTKRADYMYKLAVETILGRPFDMIEPGQPQVSNLFWPRRGIEMQSEAADALEKYAANHQIKLGKLKPTGFHITDDGKIGCSPDYLVANAKTSVEIKCPASWNQAEYLDADEEYWKTEHYPQVQCQMLVTGYQYGILFSYHPRMPVVYRKTPRDQNYINTLQAEITKFNGELAAMIVRLRKQDGWKPFEEGEQ